MGPIIVRAPFISSSVLRDGPQENKTAAAKILTNQNFLQTRARDGTKNEKGKLVKAILICDL